MGIKTVSHPLYSPYLAPCDFWLFPKLKGGCRLWENWGDERGCDEGHWHAHTRGLPWGLPEVVGMVQQVHCSWRRWLGRGLEFHVCTINKSTHTNKVWKLIVCTLYFSNGYWQISVCFGKVPCYDSKYLSITVDRTITYLYKNWLAKKAREKGHSRKRQLASLWEVGSDLIIGFGEATWRIWK